MQCFEDKAFDSDSFAESERMGVFSGIEFRRCFFKGCSPSIGSRFDRRLTVHDIKFLDCSQRGSSLGPAIVEDVLVDGFATGGQLFQSWGAVFNRVILRGAIDRMMISNDILPSVLLPQAEREREKDEFRQANLEYYRGVEWALDISNAEFKELCIRGVPSNLIRRDPNTQFCVTREIAMMGQWRLLQFRENMWPVAIELFLQRGESSIVLVAPKRHPKFKVYLDDLMMLYEMGIASK